MKEQVRQRGGDKRGEGGSRKSEIKRKEPIDHDINIPNNQHA